MKFNACKPKFFALRKCKIKCPLQCYNIYCTVINSSRSFISIQRSQALSRHRYAKLDYFPVALRPF